MKVPFLLVALFSEYRMERLLAERFQVLMFVDGGHAFERDFDSDR